MKFCDMPYKRIDFDEAKAEVRNLMEEFQKAADGEEQFAVHQKYYALTDRVSTQITLASIRHSLDTADALSSYKTMEEKLEILKDSHTGAFAIIVGCAWFILSLGVWAEVRPEMMPVLAVSFVLSRALSGLAVVVFPKAKNTGLAATFSEMAVKRTVALTMCGFLLLFGALAIWLDPVYGVPMDLAAGLVFFYYYWMSKKKFGGITGDLAGFFLTVSELVMAFTVVAVFLIRG